MNIERLHILVVDDVPDSADSTAELLRLWGYDAVACYGGAAALEFARARRPRAVVLDLAMPQMDGFRSARELHGLAGCEAVPIIAFSGYSGPEHLAQAWESGINYFVMKTSAPSRLWELLAWEVFVPAIVPALQEMRPHQKRHVSAPHLTLVAPRDPVLT